MALTSGTKLGPYEIQSPLGAGGMGEVYRARDTKLNRDVALKVLPEVFARDNERMARFRREAQILASLNHANIATIYGLEGSNGTCALVMELIQGPTLAERIRVAQGPLSGPAAFRVEKPQRQVAGVALQVDESLRIAKQIAEALEYAHERGVIHRDLKPANIKVTSDDNVKVLDFGLAKALDSQDSAPNIQDSPTLTIAATQPGVILGTVAYMSPEQACGKRVDRRADIWAFGCVLYEMLTGKQAFSGDTVSETLAAVIKDVPDLSKLPCATPHRIRELAQRCLIKDPKRRLRDIGEARIAIEETLSGMAEVQATLVPALGRQQEPALNEVKGAPVRRTLPWALTVVFLLVAIASSVSYWRLARAPAPAIVSEIGPPANSRFGYGSGLPFVISPNGRILAFRATDANGTTMLWVRPLDSPEARPLPGTEGATDPFWSADSRLLGFFADTKLKTIEVSGGSSLILADAPDELGGTWNQDGTILFVPDPAKGIYEVSPAGGTPAPVIALDSSKFSRYELGKFLPDGKHFLYTAELLGPAVAGTYFASLDGKERRLVLKDGGALYASGYMLYVRGSTLMAQAFDPERGQLKGDPHLVAQNVSASLTYGLFDISENGTLIYQTGAGREKRLTWFSRAGKNLGVTSEAADYFDLRLSPNGEKLAFNAGYPAGSPNSEIWVEELARGVRMRLTIDPATDHGIPVWSPDNGTIVFAALQGRSRLGIYRKPANGASNEELLVPSENSDTQIWPTSWSRDGRFILYAHGSITGQADIWVLPMAGDRRPRLFVQAPGAAYDGQFSPDVRWVAYTSKESGREEIYVVPFDAARVLNAGSGSPGATASGKWLISPSGGRCPRWRRDGKEIFYLSLDNQMMAAEVEERRDGIEVRPAQALFKASIPSVSAISFSPYDVSPDGKKFVVTNVSGLDRPLTLVVNWTANLKQQ
jgi:eukaryotic-like serine/threonine-protein kinase